MHGIFRQIFWNVNVFDKATVVEKEKNSLIYER